MFENGLNFPLDRPLNRKAWMPQNTLLLFCSICAHPFLLDDGSYVFIIWNNCCEFLASDSVNLQRVYQSINMNEDDNVV